MCKLLLQCLFLVVWFVKHDCQNNNNRPKITTQNGDIIIEAAFNKNIVLRQNGPRSSILAGDLDLLDKTSDIGEPSQTSTSSANFEKYFSGPNGILTRLEKLENHTSPTATDSRFSVSYLVRRVNRLFNRMTELERKVTEITSDKCASNPCQKGGTCLNLADSYHCLCPSNWEGKNCDVDVNECRNFAGTDLGCQNGATCINKPGTYECFCSPGWHGLHCTRREKDCSQGNFEMCGHGTCISSNGGKGFTCLCDQGWETNGTGVECLTDVDECDARHGPRCSVNPKVECVNWPGSFRCGQCPAGYEGDGFACSDIDECLTLPNGGCSPLVTCHNTIGSRICGPCPQGYQGDGITCTWKGSCNINNGGCHTSAQCVESMSTVQCVCPFGMDGDGIGIHGCYISTFGNFSRRCADNPCGDRGTCHQLLQGYTCVCQQGYSGAHCDVAAGPCSRNPCQNGGTCRPENSLSAFRCECTAQFSGNLCELKAKTCGGYLDNEEGSIIYPLTNTSYSDNSKCAWVIHTIPSKVINVTFSKFNLEPEPECLYDFLQIHDGRTSSSQLIGRFCGNEYPKGGNIISSHNSLYFWFRSDDTRAGSGFALHWNSIDPICGGEINASTHGLISSPGSPGKYPPNRDCYWYLSTAPSKRISLSFFILDIETHPNCSFDYLAIYNGRRSTDPLINKYCNSTQPQPITSTSSEIMIHFHSDSHGFGHGFQISFAPIEGLPGCGGLYTLDRGEITSPSYNGRYLDNLRCEYKISTGVDKKIRFEFKSFDLESSLRCKYDYVKVYDGPSTESKLIGKFCGKNTYPKYPVVSSSNNLVIILRTDRNMNYGGFKLIFETVCHKVVNGDSGVLSSPGYPFNYPPNQDCDYVVHTSPGKAIQLTFQDFNVEDSKYYNCRYDYVEVRDGPDQNSTLMGKFCGLSRFPPTQVSTHNYMHLRFHSDLSNPAQTSYKGFYANYTTIDTECGGIYKETTGLISYPFSGGKYKSNQICVWVLVAPEGMHIKLTWYSFELERSLNCQADYIELVEVDENNKKEVLGKYCGSSSPPSLTTLTNRLIIKFRSDASEQLAGFSVGYTYLDTSRTCEGTYIKSHGFIYSPGWPKRYEPNRSCTWTIQVPVGQQMLLNITQFDLEASQRNKCEMGDYLEIRNGMTQSAPLVGRYCGSFRSKHIVSLTNAMYLHFHSDFYIAGNGFQIEWTSTATRCGGTLTSSSGSIASPNYPEKYNTNQECFYKIITNRGSRIRINFVELDLEITTSCRDDYVAIYDGSDENSPILGRHCSKTPQLENIQTSSNVAFIKFRSDFFISGKGFYLNYDTICNNNISGFYGAIESPDYPNNYPVNVNCLWTINVPKGHKINITFTHFDVSYTTNWLWRHYSQCTDYVQFKESNEVAFSRKYCGPDKPHKLSTRSNSFQIKFVSGHYFPRTGFRLEWVNVGCGGKIQKGYGHLNLHRSETSSGEMECQWIIEAPLGKKVTIAFDNIYMAESSNCSVDVIEIYNGENINSPLITRFCKHLNNFHKIQSTTNLMLIRFVKKSDLKDIHFTSTFSTDYAGCGSSIRSRGGIIFSPNYPKNYDNDLNCIWGIEVPKNHRIELNFIFFDLFVIDVNGISCDDSIRIFDSMHIMGNNYSQIICPNSRLSQIISKGNIMALQFITDHVGTAKGFKANFTMICGATIVASSDGIINNDEYVMHTNRSCVWTIKAPRLDQKITLTVTHMLIPKTSTNVTIRSCPSSFLRVLDGDDENAPLINEYCGSYTPRIVSQGSALTLELGTYGERIEGQFTAHYSSLDNACGGTLLSENGEMASPNYPRPYPPDSDCEWTLSTSPGNRVYINFEDFDLESSKDCNQDYVEIRENDSGGRLFGVYCGNEIPTNTTVGSKLYVKFRSDGMGSSKGFLIKYGFLHGNEIVAQHGEITSPLYPHSFATPGEYTWRVTVPGDKIYLTITHLEIHTHGPVCTNNLVIYDGYDDEATILQNVCGVLRHNEEALRSTSNVIFIKLTLDEFNTGALFYIRWTEANNTISENTDDSKINCGFNRTELVFAASTTYITTPNFPEDYDNDLNCQWTFKTINGRHLKLDFTSFHLEERPNCFADYVSVYSSETPTDWKSVKSAMCLKDDTVGLNATTFMKVEFVSDSSMTAKGFQGRVTSVCGGVLTDLSGQVQPTWFDWSRSYGQITCNWKIKVRPGRQIRLGFLSFNITSERNLCSSYVTLRNGESLESPFLGSGKYCGSEHEVRNNLETSGNALYVSYTAIKSRIFTTFTLFYEEKNVECGGTSTLALGHASEIINSPNFPSVPIPYTECVWVFQGPPGEILRIDFIDRFDIDSRNSDCSSEYVEIRDGSSEHSPLLGRFCTENPGTIKTKNDYLYVKYSTQVSEPRNGFKANVSIDVCGGTIIASKGELSSPGYPHMAPLTYGTVCVWQLIGRVGYTFLIRAQDIYLPDSESPCATRISIEESIPENNTVTIIKEYCGDHFIEQSNAIVQTLTNNVTIKLHIGKLSSFSQNSGFRGFRLTFNSSLPLCSETITTPQGYLTTPSYPRQSTIRYCHWVITVPDESRRVTLELIDFDVERQRIGIYSVVNKNYVANIHNIPSSGYLPSNKIFESTGNSLIIYVWLDAPSGSTHRFKAKFSSENPALCGGSLSGIKELISPSLNRSYTCKWRYTTDFTNINSTIAIRTYLNSSSNSLRCRRIDPNLSILYKVRNNKFDQSISICGHTDMVYRIPTNGFEIMAKKNKHDSLYFNLDWTTHPCGGYVVIGEDPLNVLNIPSNFTDTLDCAWVISVPIGNRVTLTLKGSFQFACADEFLKIYNNNAQSTLIGEYCKDKGQESPLRMASTKIFVEYHSKPKNNSNIEIVTTIPEHQCGNLITREESLSSPNYPKQYTENLECAWEIKADLGSRVSLQFISRFAVEGHPGSCSEDAVIIYDWKDDKYTEVARLCGRERPGIYNSTFNQMKVVFRTNQEINLDGFKAQWTRICGGNYIATEKEQFLYSPGYPDSYPSYMDCVYKITSQDRTVHMKFLDFALEGPYPECGNDNLTISGEDSYDYSVSTYCGVQLPEPLLSFSTVMLTFKSDSFISKKGFKLSYWISACGGEIKEPTILSSNSMSSYDSNLNCSWKIEAPHDKIVVLNFLSFDLENSYDCYADSLAIYDGLTLDGNKRLALLCSTHDNNSNIIIKSSNNTMLLNFVTDQSQNGEGFKVAVSFSYSKSVGCGGHINLTSSTVLRSPKINSQVVYENYLDCIWTVTAPEDHVIKVNFTSFHIAPCQDVNQTALGMNKCDCDYVQLRNGILAHSTILNNYCGHILPMQVATSGNTLTLILHTDGEVASSGFEAFLSTEETICGQSTYRIQNSTATVIRSPNYLSGSVPRGLNCVYNIELAEDYFYSTVQIHVNNIDLQQETNNTNKCDGDKLVISKPQIFHNKTIGKDYVVSQDTFMFLDNAYLFSESDSLTMPSNIVICGNVKTLDLYIVGNFNFWLQTSPSSDSIDHKGFEVEVRKTNYCSRNYSEFYGRIKSVDTYLPEDESSEPCYTLITSPLSYTVSAYFINIAPHWNEDAFLEIYDGNTTSSKLLRKVGSSMNYDDKIAAFSTGRYMLIRTPSPKTGAISYDLNYVSSHRYPGCGGKLVSIVGRITSPLYPDRFRQKATCEWELETPVETRLRLHFLTFDLNAACDKNYLQLVDRQNVVVSTFCDEAPADYTSSDNYVKVRFVTTRNNGGQGWVADFVGII